MIHNILENIDAVIFDMDGSLVDSMWMWKQIDIDYFKMHNLVLPEDLQSQIEGMSFYQTAEYFKNNFGFPETIEEMTEAWNRMAEKKYKEEVFYKKGAKEFLDICKSRNIKLGIATSNSRHLVEAAGQHLEFDFYFDCILTGSEIINGKPAPDIYLLAAEKLGVDNKRCLVFEDITAGIIAGHSAGMKVCAVDDEYSIKQTEDKKKMANYFIYDYTELDF